MGCPVHETISLIGFFVDWALSFKGFPHRKFISIPSLRSRFSLLMLLVMSCSLGHLIPLLPLRLLSWRTDLSRGVVVRRVPLLKADAVQADPLVLLLLVAVAPQKGTVEGEAVTHPSAKYAELMGITLMLAQIVTPLLLHLVKPTLRKHFTPLAQLTREPNLIGLSIQGRLRT